MLPEMYLFKSQVGKNKPISRRHAYRVLKDNFERNCMTGKLGTHTMRKTYAAVLYKDLVERRAKGEPVDPFPLTARGLGHMNMGNTEKYLSFHEEDIEKSMTNFEAKLFG
jgi:site-specific recombinase XerD